jgi:hypothetical protein
LESVVSVAHVAQEGEEYEGRYADGDGGSACKDPP